MKFLAALVAVTGCNTDAPEPPPKRDAAITVTDDEPAVIVPRVRLSVGARDGQPHDWFRAQDEIFMSAFDEDQTGDLIPRDYFFRVVDSSGEEVSRTETACRRIRIDHRGRIETLYANGDAPCQHVSSTDRTHAHGGVTVGLAPFGDANAILEGVASYEVQLAPVERFTGFHAPMYAAAFVLDLRTRD